MKNRIEHEGDARLSGLLRDWKVESALPPHFTESVWRRIAAEETPALNPFAALRYWIAQRVMRPSFAFSYAAILLLIGALAGLWQAREISHRTSETLSARYVQMIDPYQMPRP